MFYLVFYLFSIGFYSYMRKKFNLNKREIVELMLLVMLIPSTLGVVSEMSNPFELLQIPLVMLFGLLFALPFVLLPVVLIVRFKQLFNHRPLWLFSFSTFVGGMSLSVFGDFVPIFVGMSLGLFSVVMHYFILKNK